MMLVNVLPEQQDFFIALQARYQELLNGDPLQKVRSKAWDHFLEIGMPTREDEKFRYVNLKDLYRRTYLSLKETQVSADDLCAAIYPECRDSCLVFVNGAYRADLSQMAALEMQCEGRLVVVSLCEAIKTYGTFLNSRWAKALKEETDPFAILNAALQDEGVFIYVPPKVILETPLQIVNIITAGQQSIVMMPRIHVYAGAHSQITFIHSVSVADSNSYFLNEVTDFTVEEGAQVKYFQVCDEEPNEAWHLNAIRTSLKKNSRFVSAGATDGCGTIRTDYHIVLAGEGSEALLHGVWWLDGQKESHTQVWMEHQAPHCHSLQLFKGALNDFSKSSFEGKIVVRQAAQKTDAFQRNNNLLLSNRAHADSKPNLEIFADDVKASHGATVGQLNQEELFYLKTRGFTDSQARSLLVYGYCKDVLEQFPLPSIQQKLQESVRQFLVKQKE